MDWQKRYTTERYNILFQIPRIFRYIYNVYVYMYILCMYMYIYNCMYMLNKLISKPTFQRRINVVSTLWIDVETRLSRRRKWKKIRRQIFNIAQRWCNVSARRWNNLETIQKVQTRLHNASTTLIQRCFNLASRFVKDVLNQIGLVMIRICK